MDGANPGLKRSFLWYRLESSGCKVSVQAIEIGIEIAIAIEIGIGIEIAIGIAIAILAPSFSRETGGLRSIGSVAWAVERTAGWRGDHRLARDEQLCASRSIPISSRRNRGPPNHVFYAARDTPPERGRSGVMNRLDKYGGLP